MSDVWLKIKFWTKVVLFAAIVVYVVLFIGENSSGEVHFWWWFDHRRTMSALVLALSSFLAGGICALGLVTTWRTLRQIRDVRDGRRMDKLERDQAEIRTKAAMLQTHAGPAVVPVPAPAGEGVTVRVDSLGGH